MKTLFQSRKVINGVATVDPDGKIIFTKAPFIKNEQLLLDKRFIQYLETIIVPKKVLGWELKNLPYKKHTK